MAEPVNLTTDQLMASIGRLTLECQVRASREDLALEGLKSLQERVRYLEAELAARDAKPTRKRSG